MGSPLVTHRYSQTFSGAPAWQHQEVGGSVMEENYLVSKPWSRAVWGRVRSRRRSSILAWDWSGTVPGRESVRITIVTDESQHFWI